MLSGRRRLRGWPEVDTRPRHRCLHVDRLPCRDQHNGCFQERHAHEGTREVVCRLVSTYHSIRNRKEIDLDSIYLISVCDRGKIQIYISFRQL